MSLKGTFLSTAKRRVLPPFAGIFNLRFYGGVGDHPFLEVESPLIFRDRRVSAKLRFVALRVVF